MVNTTHLPVKIASTVPAAGFGVHKATACGRHRALCAVQIYMGRSRVDRRCAQSSTEHMLQVCPRLAQMPKSFCLLACEARVLPLQGGRASGLLCRL